MEEPNLGQMNTLNINRLLRRLEAAISCGKHAEAAKLAHELAELRVSCSVTRNPKEKSSGGKGASSVTPSKPSTADTNANLKPLGSEAEASRAVSPHSNMSECFYDACEKLENEYGDQYSQMLVTANGDYTDLYGIMPKPLVEEKRQVSSVPSKSCNGKETTTPSAHGHDKENSQPVTARESSGTNMRETRIDPARREVKSDTISKLPDDSKDSKENVHNAPSAFKYVIYFLLTIFLI